jgi:murein L,D-transpeptidase YcbB/YkuD|tara:strand:+ start:764 stop:985 length:222 start_codon:yes stop_codon:yes gene_type:complete
MWKRLRIILNKRYSEKYGWKPNWFYAYDFDEVLTKRIKKFQRKFGLFPSGVCGKKTHRLVLLVRLLDIKRRKD